jgi:hypothetical protein
MTITGSEHGLSAPTQWHNGARLPGPLQFVPGVYLAPNAPSKAVTKPFKQEAMPPPTGTSTTMVASDMKWSLAGTGSDFGFKDVKQGELANCPLAALLAAHAHTDSGRKLIGKWVSEKAGAIETDLAAIAGKLADVPPGKIIRSNRYFAVQLGGQAFDVSPVLYTDEARDPSPIYMSSPDSALWPCMIEKAFAIKVGTYDDLDDDTKWTVNKIWETVTGVAPGGFSVASNTPQSKIVEAAKLASSVPTLAASRDDATDVTSHHGFAVLGMSKGNLNLYDPSAARTLSISIDKFRGSFQAIFFTAQ